MEAARRYRYLKAMGVPVWRPREQGPTPATASPETSAAAAETPRSAPIGPPATLAFERPTAPIAPRPAPAAGRAPEPTAGPDRDQNIAALDWPALRAAVAGCRACALCETRTQTVFGVGDPTADLMVIGEAPGADEDRAGEPFVGRAGQLLTRMLLAIGLDRGQVFIANILKCRPPGNRDPLPDEVRQCEPFLLRQIELVAPRVILAVGRVSAQCLLRTDAPIGRLRGRWHGLGQAPRGGTDIPLYVTYHPAYLLRSPAQKAAAWQDLVAVARRLRAPGTEASGR